MEKNILISARINLRALIFWLRNKKMADKQNDIEEAEKSHKSILFQFRLLDDIGITFRTQNDIMYKATNKPNYGISDIMADTTIYFRNGFEINGSELNKVY